jgi:hypothetical protein
MQTIQFFAVLVAAASEMAGESLPTRRLMVNIPARKIALVEDGKIVRMYSVAVGKKSTPSPSGTFHIASHVANPSASAFKATASTERINPNPSATPRRTAASVCAIMTSKNCLNWCEWEMKWI